MTLFMHTPRILERIGHDPLVANYVSFIRWDRSQAVLRVTNSSIPLEGTPGLETSVTELVVNLAKAYFRAT